MFISLINKTNFSRYGNFDKSGRENNENSLGN